MGAAVRAGLEVLAKVGFRFGGEEVVEQALGFTGEVGEGVERLETCTELCRSIRDWRLLSGWFGDLLDEFLAGGGEVFVDFVFGCAKEVGDFVEGEAVSVAKEQGEGFLGGERFQPRKRFPRGSWVGAGLFFEGKRMGLAQGARVEPRADVFFPHKTFWVVEGFGEGLPGDIFGCFRGLWVTIEQTEGELLNPWGEVLDEVCCDGRVGCAPFLNVQGKGGFGRNGVGHSERTKKVLRGFPFRCVG